jgi:hypothetical protein
LHKPNYLLTNFKKGGKMKQSLRIIYVAGARCKVYKGRKGTGQAAMVIGDTVVFLLAVVVKMPVVSFNFSGDWNSRINLLYLNYNGLDANVHGHFTPAISKPTMVVYKKAIDDLKDAYDDDLAGEPNAAETLMMRWRAILIMTRQVCSYVANLCYEKPEQTAEICGDCHLEYYISQGRDKNVCGCKSEVPGEIEATGVVRYQRQCTDWEICLDPKDPKNWLLIKVPPTIAAETVIKGLTSGVEYYVRSRVCGKNGPEEWSEIICIRVK